MVAATRLLLVLLRRLQTATRRRVEMVSQLLQILPKQLEETHKTAKDIAVENQRERRQYRKAAMDEVAK